MKTEINNDCLLFLLLPTVGVSPLRKYVTAKHRQSV